MNLTKKEFKTCIGLAIISAIIGIALLFFNVFTIAFGALIGSAYFAVIAVSSDKIDSTIKLYPTIESARNALFNALIEYND